MSAPRIIAFAGSLRRDSLNKKLVRVAARGAEAAGAEVTHLDLSDYLMPIYDQDIEDRDGLPDAAKTLKDMFRAHDGLLISSPEYNSGYSAALKNMIDWISRPEENHPPLSCFTGKVAGLMAASPGGLGGLRGLVQVRMLLENIRVTCIPSQMAVSKAHEAFDDDDNLKDDKQRETVEGIGRQVAEMLSRLAD